MQDEIVLIKRTRAGDQQAFARLVEQYQSQVYNLCYRMLGNSGEAEDAAQETFLRAFSRLKTYDESRKFSSWLLSIGSHYCIDRLRRRRFTWTDIDDLAPKLESSRSDDRPEHVYLQAELADEVQRMLGNVSPLYRTVLILRYWQHASYEEMGEILGISESAVKSRLHRARKAMADVMQEQSAARGQLTPAVMQG
jgi:RNA polymerase sigma-70 factor, ECF subfamily